MLQKGQIASAWNLHGVMTAFVQKRITWKRMYSPTNVSRRKARVEKSSSGGGKEVEMSKRTRSKKVPNGVGMNDVFEELVEQLLELAFISGDGLENV